MSLLTMLSWSPSGVYPTATATALPSINPSHFLGLSKTLSEALASAATATYKYDLVSLSEVIRGAEASLTIIEAELVLATATALLVQAELTEAIWHAHYNLKALADEENLYGYNLNRGGNIFFFVLFTLIVGFNVGMLLRSRYHWYNVAFILGFALQWMGFLGRILAFNDNTNINYFLLQYVTLTLSPAFIMGGIYFLFAQNVIVHGRHYSILKPLWYSYFFVFCDVLSLVIQGTGGGMASVATQNKEDASPGVWTMFGGILFQVVAMSIFVVFWFEFLGRTYFHDAAKVEGDSPYKKRSVLNYLKLLIGVPSAKRYQQQQLEPFYNPRYASIRSRKLPTYYPLAISVAVLVIYIRCIYRVVELKQGFSGYLIEHEVFLMTLDASMIAISGLIFVPFHPVFVFGRENVLKLATIKARHDVHEEEPEKDVTDLATSDERF